MGTITSQPSTSNLHGIQTGLDYTFEMTVSNNDTEPAISIDVLFNGAVVETLYNNAYESLVEVSNNDTYTYSFDIAEVLQRQFNNVSFFNPSTRPYNATGLQGEVQVKVYEWQPNSDGQLVKQGSSTDSNTINVINSMQSVLSDYNAATGRKFLTNEPQNGKVYTGYSRFVAIWVSSATHNSFRIRTYDSANTLLATGIVSMVGNNKLYIIDLKPSNLTNYTFEEETGTVNDANLYKITIDAGFWNDITFSSASETRNYIVHNECRGLVLHFQNIYGCQDTYLFERYEQSYRTEGDTYKRSATGDRKLTNERTKEYRVISESNYSNVFNWLIEIGLSVIGYIEDSDGIREVVINDSDILRDEKNILGLEYILTESSKQYSHIN